VGRQSVLRPRQAIPGTLHRGLGRLPHRRYTRAVCRRIRQTPQGGDERNDHGDDRLPRGAGYFRRFGHATAQGSGSASLTLAGRWIAAEGLGPPSGPAILGAEHPMSDTDKPLSTFQILRTGDLDEARQAVADIYLDHQLDSARTDRLDMTLNAIE